MNTVKGGSGPVIGSLLPPQNALNGSAFDNSQDFKFFKQSNWCPLKASSKVIPDKFEKVDDAPRCKNIL